MSTIAILDYGAGNQASVQRALKRLGAEAEILTAATELDAYERVIFPGVGAAGQAMGKLRELGWDQALRSYAAAGGQLLGICLGMQLLFEHSDEDGGVDCLGLLPGRVVRFDVERTQGLKIPHMGWNQVRRVNGGARRAVPLQATERGWFYFVHSYHASEVPVEMVLAETEHGYAFPSMVGQGNVLGVQFHPEKSGESGMALLRQWLEVPC